MILFFEWLNRRENNLKFDLKKYFLISILLLAAPLFAQRITLCRAFTDNGEPIDLIYSSNIRIGQSVCILFSGEKKKLNGSISLFIDKTDGGERNNQLRQIFISPKENWLTQVFKFQKEGRYEIYFENENRIRYASTTVTVGHPEIKTVKEKETASRSGSAKIVFTSKIIDGKPADIKENISLRENGGSISIYLSDKQPIGTKLLRLSLWRSDQKGKSYDELSGSKIFIVDPSWSDTYLKYTFGKTGEYKIIISDENEILIKTAYISVNN